jgi:hypothetical protein
MWGLHTVFCYVLQEQCFVRNSNRSKARCGWRRAFRVRRDWVIATEIGESYNVTASHQLYSMARTYYPLTIIVGPHWCAKDTHGRITSHLDREVTDAFSETYCTHWCKRPNQYINMWEGKANTRQTILEDTKVDVSVVHLTHDELCMQLHRGSCVISSFVSAFEFM